MTISGADEAELIIAAVKGDAEAFGVLCAQSHRALLSVAARRLGRHGQMAPDVVQTVYLRALGALPLYKDRGRPFVAWLHTIANNVVLDYLKSSTTRRENLTDWSDTQSLPGWSEPGIAEELQPDHVAVQDERVWSVIRVLNSDRTNVRHREVLLRRYYLDQSVEETAAAMGLGVGTVRTLTYRATNAARRELSRQEA